MRQAQGQTVGSCQFGSPADRRPRVRQLQFGERRRDHRRRGSACGLPNPALQGAEPQPLLQGKLVRREIGLEKPSNPSGALRRRGSRTT